VAQEYGAGSERMLGWGESSQSVINTTWLVFT
jgi:hypothetical protein